MARLFSQRHRKAIFDRKLVVSFSQRLSRRVWMIMERFDEDYTFTDSSGWQEPTSTLSETEARLKETHGWEALRITLDKRKKNVDLKTYVQETYPSEVLDAVEAFYLEMPARHDEFAAAINEAFEDEGAPWRLSVGQFFKVDSEFLRLHVLAAAQQLLIAEGFEGASEEFKDARNDLTAGDYKGAIHNAGKAYESALKAVLGVVEGNANHLLSRFNQEGFLDDLPEEMRGGVVSQVLLALPFLRNRLGGHGQGETVLEVQRRHAELAVHLAGSFIYYVMQAYLSRKPAEEPEEEAPPFSPFEADEDLPF